MDLKFEILYTEYEDYFAHNLAAIIINLGGTVRMTEVFSNENFYHSNNTDYTGLFIFPSNYITYKVVSPYDFIKEFAKFGNLSNLNCIDFSNVIDVADGNKCKEIFNVLSAIQSTSGNSFKNIVKIDRDLCLDNLFHRKVGVFRTQKLEYIAINGRFSGELSQDVLDKFGNPKISYLINEQFSYSDFVMKLDEVDFCIVNDVVFKKNSAICQICNYKSKPLLSADLTQSNLSNHCLEAFHRLINDQKFSDDDLTYLLKKDLVDRKALDGQLLDILMSCAH